MAGLAGPCVFTCAWIAGSLRQAGHPPASLAISGLAAPDARDPWIMITGFLVLGGCAVAFGAGLRDDLGGHDTGSRLVQAAGVLTIAAGLLRRDHLMLTTGPVSWHNHAHDVVSALIYADLVLAQLLLAWRFGRDPRWRRWRPWMLAGAAATAGLLVAFGIDTSGPAAGVLQRVLVTIPLAAVAAISVGLLRTRRRDGPQKCQWVPLWWWCTPGNGENAWLHRL